MSNIPYLYSTLFVLISVSLIGFISSSKVSSATDFTVASRSLNSRRVAGSIIATIVGGASTIGTAELAYKTGVNAVWFTLGASLACLFLGLFIAGPMRESGASTISEYMVRFYGNRARLLISLLTSVAIFIHVNGQVLSAVAILTSLFLIKQQIAVVITILLIISYIMFGGFWATSIIGIIKTILLYITLMICALIISAHSSANQIIELGVNPWFNIFSDGIFSGLAQGFSLVVGITTTQTYLQAMFAGKSVKDSKRGAYISAILIPPIGFICTLIGLFMRVNHPNIMASRALPSFILNYLNPMLGGIMIATLIISVVGTGAGLTLGISTMISRDIYKGIINKYATDKEELRVNRYSVLALSIISMIIVFSNMNSLILKWGFLSMALRGCVIFVPLLYAIYLPNKAKETAGILSMVIAPSITIMLSMIGLTIVPPLYVGLGVSLIIFVVYDLRRKS